MTVTTGAIVPSCLPCQRRLPAEPDLLAAVTALVDHLRSTHPDLLSVGDPAGHPPSDAPRAR